MKSQSANKNIQHHTAQHLHKSQQLESVPTSLAQIQTALAEARLEAHLQTSLRPHGARHLWMQSRS